MKEIIRTFNGRFIRVIIQKGIEWFVTKDVCEVLELSDHRDAVRNLKERFERAGLNTEGMVTTHPLKTAGGIQEMLCVNEQGLYELIFASRKEEAIRFRAWVTGELLPSIRKTGKYDVRDIREKSVEARHSVTDEWKRQGVSKPSEYGGLTRTSYYCLYHKHDVKKADMDREQVLKLAAFESLEAWRLNKIPENTLGYQGCELSISETVDLIDRSGRPRFLNEGVAV